MSEVEGATPTPVTPVPDPIYAGKFTGPEALEQGFREIHKPLGLVAPADGVPLIGEGRPYATAKDLEAAYQAHQKLLSSRKTDPPAPPKEPQAPAQQGPPTPGPSALEVPVETPLSEDAGTMDIAIAAGIDLAQAEAELTNDGTLSAENLAKLKAKMPGITTKMANEMGASLIRSVSEVKARLVENAKTLAGGDTQLKNLLAFAAEGKSVEERRALTAKLNDIRNPEAAELAFLKIVRSYEAKHGKPGTPGAPSGSIPSSVKTVTKFTSQDELRTLRSRAAAGDVAAQAQLKGSSVANQELLQRLV